MDKGTILEIAGRNNNIDQFDSSHLAMTGDKIAKTKTLTAEMHKTDHNHHTKPDKQTTRSQNQVCTLCKKVITLLENVKLVLIA